MNSSVLLGGLRPVWVVTAVDVGFSLWAVALYSSPCLCGSVVTSIGGAGCAKVRVGVYLVLADGLEWWCVMQGMIRVTVRFFGPAGDWVGQPQAEYGLAGPARLGDLVDLMAARHPRLAAGAAAVRFAINEEYADLSIPLADGDEVAVIPPVAGGGPSQVTGEGRRAEDGGGGQSAEGQECRSAEAEPSPVGLTAGPIGTAEVVRRVGNPACGAIVTFEGVVRLEGPADDPLEALEYSAYEPMAVKKLGRIRTEALERFEIHDVQIVHRTGRVAIGQTAVVVAVSARHRGDAFEACQWVIDALKLDVPIWKKEVRSRGGCRWVDPTKEAVP